MLVEIIDGLPEVQGGKHRAAGHVMAVENADRIDEAAAVSRILENGAGGVVGTVIAVMEIGVVGLAVHHRVIDHGIRTVDPADHIGIDLPERLKIHLDRSHFTGFRFRRELAGVCFLKQRRA